MLQRLDDQVLYAMRTRWHSRGAETVGRALGEIGAHGAIWLVIGAAMALIDGDQREQWLIAGLLAPFAIGANYAVKLIVRRKRPVLEDLPPLGGAPSSLSFPSGHATSSFAAATAMTRIAPEASVLFLLAAAISAGRPYLGMHYPSDVIAGAALGVAIGLAVPIDSLAEELSEIT